MTTWGSKNAEDMYQIATRMAGFDPKELMLEIGKLQRRNLNRRTNLTTVLNAMQTIKDRYDDQERR